MSGDDMKKVRPGEPLEIPARTFNTFIDAARAFRQSGSRAPGPPPAQGHRRSVVIVQNISGANCDRFGVLAVNSPIFNPATDLASFQDAPSFVGTLPQVPADHGRFAVLVEPIADGNIGLAIVAGVTPVQVDVVDAAHKYADLKHEDVTMLQSRIVGGAQILSKETGTGTKWGLIRFPAGPIRMGDTFTVRLWQDGGTTDGAVSTECNRTYKARTLDATGPDTGGRELGTGLTPDRRRWVPDHYGKYVCPGSTGAGVVGVGYYDDAGNFCLYDANETIDTSGC